MKLTKRKQKLKKFCLSLAILLSFSNIASFGVFADEEDGFNGNEIEYGEQVDNLTADGKQDTEDGDTYTTEDTETDTNTTQQSSQKNSNTSNKKTQKQIDISNTSRYKEDVRKKYKEWISKIKQTSNYTDGKWFGNDTSSTSVKNLSYITVPNTEIADVLNKNTDYKNSLNENSIGLDTEYKPSMNLETNAYDSDYGSMSSAEKNAVKTGIVLTEKQQGTSNTDINTKMQNTMQNRNARIGNDDFTLGQNNDGSLNLQMNNNLDKSNLTNNGNYTNPRTDLMNGETKLALNNESSYWKRLKPLYEKAGQEDWEYNWNGNNKYYKTSGYAQSNALSDETYIALLTEYNIQTVKKDVITKVDYTSPDRRWTIYLDDVQVCEPVITTNPLHELDFNAVYQEYGAGDYYVVAEQLANYTKATYVTYDKCTYLFEMSTGTLLYFNEEKVDNGRGGGIYIQSETSTTPDWVETGDTYTIRVNNNGEVETNGDTGSKRTD